MSDRYVKVSSLLVLLLAGGFSTETHAQARSDAQIRADIEYARGLAQRFRYVDLAEEMILELEEARPSADTAIALALAKCDIYGEGARREADKSKRNALYDKALQAYTDFLDANEFADERPQAERSFVDLSNSYSLILERDLEELVGEEADAVREKMRGVLDQAVERTGDLLDAIAPSSELSALEKEEKWRLMLNMGQLRITQAKLSETGTFLFSEADTILEELAFDAKETSGWGLNAYLLMAKSKLAQGEYYDAAAYAEYVVDLVIPADEETRNFQEWDKIPQELRQARWEMVERGTPDLIEAYALAGDQKSATNWGLSAYNKWKEFGFDLTPRGSLAMLALGNTLVDAGGWIGGNTTQGNLQWFETEDEMSEAGFSGRRASRRAVDLALSLAQDINQDNKGNILQVYAQALIKRVRDVPGIQLDPGILYEAAEGTYYEQNYPEAIEAMKGVVASLQSQDEATQREFMPKIMYFTGQSLARMDRDLEAAMAFREGIESWKGDLDYDTRNAQQYYVTIGRARSASGNDPVLNELWLAAEKHVQEVSEDTGDITWRQGERAYGEKDYAGAREKYLAVEPSSDNHEKAIAKAALCLYKMGDFERAQAEFAKYVDEFVVDPANTPSTGEGRAARSQALAQATFYLGRIAYEASDWATTIARMSGFDEKFPDQSSYAANALYMVLMAHLKTTPPAFDEARAVHTVLEKKFRDQSVTGRGALQIFVVLDETFKALGEGADAASAAQLQRDMAEMLNISNGLDRTPAWGNLRRETDLWLGLEEWEKAEAVARRTMEVHGDDQEKLVKFVAPDLGRALLRQKRVAEAFEVLDAVVPDPDSPQKGQPGAVEDWCRAVCGWVEGSGNQIAEVPGLGGKENFEKAMKHLLSLENLAQSRFDKWTCPWYAAKFDRIYGYYQYGQLDSTHLDNAKGQIEFLQTELEADLSSISEACGGDETTRRRLLWLDSKLP